MLPKIPSREAISQTAAILLLLRTLYEFRDFGEKETQQGEGVRRKVVGFVASLDGLPHSLFSSLPLGALILFLNYCFVPSHAKRMTEREQRGWKLFGEMVGHLNQPIEIIPDRPTRLRT